MTDPEARAVADRTARTSYGRLVALLAASTGTVALAEDTFHARSSGLGDLARQRRRNRATRKGGC